MSIPKLASYPMPKPASFPANKVAWSLDPSRAALLIHDMQRYFVAFYGEASPLVAHLVESIVTLKRWARAKGMPVVYTAQPIDQSPKDRALLNDMWGRGIDNQPELKGLAQGLEPEPGDVVLDKWRYSAFVKSDLDERLRSMGKDQLLICGVYGHIGVMMTAAHAFMLDVKPFLVGDAIADFSPEDHAMALRYVATLCGNVVSLAQVLDA